MIDRKTMQVAVGYRDALLRANDEADALTFIYEQVKLAGDHVEAAYQAGREAERATIDQECQVGQAILGAGDAAFPDEDSLSREIPQPDYVLVDYAQTELDREAARSEPNAYPDAMAFPEDADIDCPLFRALQQFLIEAFAVEEHEAVEASREFMRDYWLGVVNK